MNCELLDMAIAPRVIKDPPKMPFEHTPEYKAMVQRAIDSLQRVEDSLRNIATDTASAANDTLTSATKMLSDSIATQQAGMSPLPLLDVAPIPESTLSNSSSTIMAVIVALLTLTACIFSIVRYRKLKE